MLDIKVPKELNYLYCDACDAYLGVYKDGEFLFWCPNCNHGHNFDTTYWIGDPARLCGTCLEKSIERGNDPISCPHYLPNGRKIDYFVPLEKKDFEKWSKEFLSRNNPFREKMYVTMKSTEELEPLVLKEMQENSKLSEHKRDLQPSRDYYRNIRKIAGKRIEIDTEFLFEDQLNTKAGLRIHEWMYSDIENDLRIGACYCNYCHNWSKLSLGKCRKGCELRFLQPFRQTNDILNQVDVEILKAIREERLRLEK